GNDISLRQLPMGEKELFKFDVILLFDPDGKYLPPDWTEILKDFVGEHRGGLGFVAGNKHTLNLLRGQGGNFMADLLPVVLDDQRADQPGVGIGYGRHWNQPWRMVPEPAGLRHAATRFHSNPRRARAEVWDRLPPFYWNFPVLREKPGATVLARHEDPRESVEPYGQRPIIAVHRYGGGNVMFLATDETNRWRARAEPIFDRFWVQSVRFLIEGRHAGKKKQFRIYLDREVVDLGDALQIDAEVFDETYQPLELEEVQILVTGPNDKEHAVTLQPVQDKPGRYTGSFSPVIEGDYEVRAADVKFKTKSPSATFMVKFPDREMGDVRVDEALLSDLARRTRGLSPKIYELEKLADPKLIPPVTERIVTQGTPIPLWDTWLTIIVIVTLLCAEWILRKKFRMV
ncbi:MAG: hypothetical protein O7E54_10445, partial [Planctomycetota bacterium]|nr:hypothetical protein [Planctomycetota bacterium]